MDWSQLAVVGFGSAVIAAFVSGAFQLLADARRRRFEHLAGAREAHAHARDRHLPELLAVIAFVDDQIRREAQDVIGFLVVYHPKTDPQVDSWNDAFGVLRRIALLHPTPTVREHAEALRRKVQNAWVDPEHGTGEWEQLNAWSSELGDLARNMHLD